MNKKENLTNREWLLLSAYLDGELSKRKKRQVEELLQSKPASRKALEVLRRIHQVLQHAPSHEVPRNFTLTADMVAKPLLPSFSKVLSYSSALAGLLLVIVFGFDVYSRSAFAGEAQVSQTVSEESQTFAVEKDMAVEPQEKPDIINWGYSSGDSGGYGLGGGADGLGGMGTGMGGGVVAPSEAEAAPPREEIESEEMLAQDDEQAESLILGVQPEEERGQIMTEISDYPEQAVQEREFPLRLVEWVLSALVLLTGLGAFILRKRRK